MSFLVQTPTGFNCFFLSESIIDFENGRKMTWFLVKTRTCFIRISRLFDSSSFPPWSNLSVQHVVFSRTTPSNSQKSPVFSKHELTTSKTRENVHQSRSRLFFVFLGHLKSKWLIFLVPNKQCSRIANHMFENQFAEWRHCDSKEPGFLPVPFVLEKKFRLFSDRLFPREAKAFQRPIGCNR